MSQTTDSRVRNEQWDAFVEIFEYEPLTESETKLWGKLTTSLRRAGATREKLIFAAKEYRKEFSTASLTPTALEKHYSRCVRSFQRKKEVKTCPECGIGGGFHLTDCKSRGQS
jgi:hypothetical protein